MALAPLGTLDLSVITDALLQKIRDCYATWPLWDVNGGPITKFDIGISGSMPESVRSIGGCQLTLYLLQVKENGHLKNSPVLGRPLTVPFQPLALDLYYLLTAFADKDYREEQRAMSIAVRCLYDEPIVHLTVPINGTPVPEEFVLQMEIESADELGRVWQAFNAPFRLSAVYRVSVVFVTPEAFETPLHRKPDHVVVSPEPDVLPASAAVEVLGTSNVVEGFAPDSTPGSPQPTRYHLSPAVVPLGGTFLLLGRGLDDPTAQRVFLVPATGPEQDVTAWVDPSPAQRTSSRIALIVPAGGGAPAPGVHQLRVGAGGIRSNATEVSIAARVAPATNPPLLVPAAGLFTLAGAGFVGPAVEILLGPVPLSGVGGAPGAGEFQVASPTSIAFRAPAGLETGRYEVRVRVNGVETPPQWWVDVP
jgi:uncharacterized protein DUF4255